MTRALSICRAWGDLTLTRKSCFRSLQQVIYPKMNSRLSCINFSGLNMKRWKNAAMSSSGSSWNQMGRRLMKRIEMAIFGDLKWAPQIVRLETAGNINGYGILVFSQRQVHPAFCLRGEKVEGRRISTWRCVARWADPGRLHTGRGDHGDISISWQMRNDRRLQVMLTSGSGMDPWYPWLCQSVGIWKGARFARNSFAMSALSREEMESHSPTHHRMDQNREQRETAVALLRVTWLWTKFVLSVHGFYKI